MSAANIKKVENMQKRALKFMYPNVADDSYDNLLHLSGFKSMIVCRLKKLCTEIYKTLHSINPACMKNLFYQSNLRRYIRPKYNIKTQKYNQVSFGDKTFESWVQKYGIFYPTILGVRLI